MRILACYPHHISSSFVRYANVAPWQVSDTFYVGWDESSSPTMSPGGTRRLVPPCAYSAGAALQHLFGGIAEEAASLATIFFEIWVAGSRGGGDLGSGERRGRRTPAPSALAEHQAATPTKKRRSFQSPSRVRLLDFRDHIRRLDEFTIHFLINLSSKASTIWRSFSTRTASFSSSLFASGSR
jgi:hypothetical protein